MDDLLENRIFPKQKCFAMLRCGYKTDSAVSESVVRTNIVTDSQDLLRNQIFEGKVKQVSATNVEPDILKCSWNLRLVRFFLDP